MKTQQRFTDRSGLNQLEELMSESEVPSQCWEEYRQFLNANDAPPADLAVVQEARRIVRKYLPRTPNAQPKVGLRH